MEALGGKRTDKCVWLFGMGREREREGDCYEGIEEHWSVVPVAGRGVWCGACVCDCVRVDSLGMGVETDDESVCLGRRTETWPDRGKILVGLGADSSFNSQLIHFILHFSTI